MSGRKQSVTKMNSHYVQQYDAYMLRQKRKKQRLIRRLALFSIVVMLTVGLMTTYHFKQRHIKAEKTAQYEQLEKQLADLQHKEKALKEEIQLLNDDEYILDIARSNYFFSKKGEVIFNDPKKDSSY